MPIIDSNGRTIRGNELDTLIKMLRGSYESHIAEFLKIQTNDMKDYTGEPVPDYSIARLISAFRKRLETLEADFQKASQSPQIFHAETLLKNDMENIIVNTIQEYGPEKIINAINLPGLAAEFDSDCSFLLNDFKLDRVSEILNDPIVHGYGTDGMKDFSDTSDEFALTDTPIEGVEDIMEFNPGADRILSIYDNLYGNSDTLSWTEEKIKKETDQFKTQLVTGKITEITYEKRMAELKDNGEKRTKALFAINSCAEATRHHACNLMNKPFVTGADMFNIFSELNSTARLGDKEGGKLRGNQVNAGNINGVSSVRATALTYKTMQKLADCMNSIKQQKDPALRRTQAIQLASFAYQMTLSEHIFSDGNGRTCRMFSDAILESFGLPPHTPTKDEMELAGTLGDKLDFEKGMRVFADEVKLSSEKLIGEKKKEYTQNGKDFAKEQQLRKEALNSIVTPSLSSDENLEHLRQLNKDAIAAKGTFRDSDQYKRFLVAAEVNLSLAEAVNAAEKAGSKNIDISKLSANTMNFIKIANPDAKTIDLNAARGMLRHADTRIKSLANEYKDYKLKDHTVDPKSEPGKKPLNKDDVKKLSVISRAISGPKPKEKALEKETVVKKSDSGIHILK